MSTMLLIPKIAEMRGKEATDARCLVAEKTQMVKVLLYAG